VVLNPVKFPWDYPGMRLLMALGCGALVVSEHCDDTAPYEAGRHFVTAAPDALADTILHFLEHEDERAAIAEAGRRFVTEELTIDRTVDALVEAAGFRTEGGEAS
jgi:glycosyltransferase involved in cell wall biosynthesis